MKKLFYPVALAVLCALLHACNSGTTYSAKEFSSPDIKWRPVPLWFWNNASVNDSTLTQELGNIIDTDGYGGCAILPFGQNFAPAYLSEEYFALYGKAIEEAARRGAQMSLYDEYGFPSGSMGAINGNGVPTFAANHPGKTLKRLDKQEFEVKRNKTLSLVLSDIPGKLMAVVAADKDAGQVVSLREDISDGELKWKAPSDGKWTVMVFNCVSGDDPNVDYLDAEAVKLFIEDTHEQYYKHFPEAFGTTITSTFFDEPTMYRCEGRVWSEKFNEEFEKRYGFHPDTFYPSLWYDMGDETSVQRNMMFGLRAQLYAEGFMKTVAEWATAHNILSTGHQDQEEICNTTSVSGDLMLDGKYMTMPGIDKIGGDRPAEHFYKVVSSSAQNWDHTQVMSETYGAMGNIPMDEMYRIAIEQYTKGITNLIPHAVWYDDKQVTFLPELSWRNPLYNTQLKDFNTFLARLRYILARDGKHKADIAVVYPIQTLQAGHRLDGELGWYAGGVSVPGTDYSRISAILTDELGRDFTYLHPEVIDDRCKVDTDGSLVMENVINTERFSTIILPGIKVISISNLKKINEALEAGAKVIFTTQIPDESADVNASNDEIRLLAAQILNNDNAFFVREPSTESIQDALSGTDADVTFETLEHPFNYIHKEIGGANVYYFGNIDSTASTCTIHLRDIFEDACLLDPHNGECSSIKVNGRVELTLEPYKSVFLVESDSESILTRVL